MIAPAAMRERLEVYFPWKNARPTGSVRIASVCTITRASKNSFQVHIKMSTTRVVVAGLAKGQRIAQSVCQRLQPSIVAASTSSLGVFSKNEDIQSVPKETLKPTWGKMSAQ